MAVQRFLREQLDAVGRDSAVEGNLVAGSISPSAVGQRPPGSRGRLIRIASVPSVHVYVRHIADPAGDDVLRIPDPLPPGPDPLPGQWWPPAMLSPSWVLKHHDDFDIFHIQFGFDAQDPSCLEEL